jgi:hypothetical protein
MTPDDETLHMGKRRVISRAAARPTMPPPTVMTS